VGKRPSKDGKRDDSETPTSVVLCNLRIVPEHVCSSGDAHPSLITVDILMCLMFEKRTAHAKSNEAGGSTVHPFSRRRRSFGATSTTEDVLSGVNLRAKQILVPVFWRDWAWRGRAHSPHVARMLSARHGVSKKAEAATAQVLLLCGFVEAHFVTRSSSTEGERFNGRTKST
jgi:hypothetical protein